MNVLFVSFEYPIETGGGGIGTYLQQTLRVFPEGHLMIIMAGTRKNDAFWENKNVFRIPSNDWEEFDQKSVHYFEILNERFHFKVVEGTDYKAAGLAIKKRFPHIPFVVKLHTPSYLVDSLQFRPMKGVERIRFIAGSLLRLQYPRLHKTLSNHNYLAEFEILQMANSLHATSQSIVQKMIDMKMVKEEQRKITHVFPYNYDLSRFLSVPLKSDAHQIVVTFIGRKEIRKGVIEFAVICRQIANQFPDVIFQFVGNSAASPKKGVNMDDFLRKMIGGRIRNIRIRPAVPYEKVIEVYNESTIMVFPSHYESFGMVCAESMAMGKAVIGSKFGGMSEMIDENSGILIDPFDLDEFRKALIDLLVNVDKRIRLGSGARLRAANFFSRENTIDKQMNFYHRLGL